MANFAWPTNLQPISFGFHHIDADTSGGAGIGGGEQFVVSPGPRWGAAMTLPITSVDEVLSIRALRASLKGRANGVVLPALDGQRANWPVEAATGRKLYPRVAQALLGTVNLGGTPYSGAEIPAAAQINATIATGGAAARATTIAINMTQGAPIRAGQQFSIAGASRLYEIGKVVSVVGAVTTVDIWPPLRTAAAAAAAVEFMRPICVMRCLNLDEELRELELLRFATLNLSFVELL